MMCTKGIVNKTGKYLKRYMLIIYGEDIWRIKWGEAMVEEENHPDDMLSKEEEAILRVMKTMTCWNENENLYCLNYICRLKKEGTVIAI
jgi:hypothetical protein